MSDNNENKFNKVKYDNDYIKNNYDQVRFTVKKGKKEELKIHCSKFGYKSLNDFINQAVNEKIARDLGEI
ncbi:hypothetical protein [Blautia faecis]|uniref:hypothetical protein n=1 Tax=Blautia faecis TaxID=871665 RepID=UPI0015D2C4BB|nr:hypothetical protein [Blautia faecis]